MRAIEKRLKDRIKALEIELETVKADRQRFREEFSHDFRWLIKLLGANEHPRMSDYIEKKAKVLRCFDWWYW